PGLSGELYPHLLILRDVHLSWIKARVHDGRDDRFPNPGQAPMASPSSQQGYSLTQIVLHWLIAALVIFQILFGEDIGPAYRAFSKATEPSAADLFNANLHVYAGIAIFVLAILRVAIRVTRGAPAAPADE